MNEIYEKLKVPFPLDAHEWKPGATTRDNDRCLALAYVDPRAYIERLNELDVEWSDDYQTIILDDRIFITCRLTVNGQTRTDVGEEYLAQDRAGANVYTTAVAQAFKRACVKFGLGAYLYSLPSEWVDYDDRYKRITDKGKLYLQGVLAHALGQSDQKPQAPEPEQKPEQPKRAEQIRKRTKRGKYARPMKPDVVKEALATKASEGSGKPASEKQAALVARLAQEVWADDKDAEQKYHSCLVYLFNSDSAKGLTGGQASAMISYLREEPDSSDNWGLHPEAIKEMNFILAEAMRSKGQQDMFENPFDEEWEDTTTDD